MHYHNQETSSLHCTRQHLPSLTLSAQSMIGIFSYCLRIYENKKQKRGRQESRFTWTRISARGNKSKIQIKRPHQPPCPRPRWAFFASMTRYNHYVVSESRWRRKAYATSGYASRQDLENTTPIKLDQQMVDPSFGGYSDLLCFTVLV